MPANSNSAAYRSHRYSWLALPIVVCALAMPSSALAAAGTLDLSWDACSPLVADIDPAGSGSVSLYASVTGHSDPHKAYEVLGYLGNADDAIPDAWEFYSPDGCQGFPRIQIDHLPSPAEAGACPAFQGSLPSLQIKAFQLPPKGFGYPTTLGQFILLNAYPSGIQNPDPNTRYFLGRFRFDHTASVPGAAPDPGHCGGYDESLCFFVDPARANYVSLDGATVPFVRGQVFVTFRGECKSVPATNATWGQIKGQYRR